MVDSCKPGIVYPVEAVPILQLERILCGWMVEVWLP
jgi:hypothetical protein